MEKTFRDAESDMMDLDGVEEWVKSYERRGFADVARIPVMMCSAEDAQKTVFDSIFHRYDEDVKDVKTVDRSA